MRGKNVHGGKGGLWIAGEATQKARIGYVDPDFHAEESILVLLSSGHGDLSQGSPYSDLLPLDFPVGLEPLVGREGADGAWRGLEPLFLAGSPAPCLPEPEAEESEGEPPLPAGSEAEPPRDGGALLFLGSERGAEDEALPVAVPEGFLLGRAGLAPVAGRSVLVGFSCFGCVSGAESGAGELFLSSNSFAGLPSPLPLPGPKRRGAGRRACAVS